MIRYEKRHFLIDTEEFLCDHGCLFPIKSRMGKYIPGHLYNQTKDMLIKDWKRKRFLGINSSEYITDLTYYEISESNIKCEIFTRQLWNDMKTLCIETTPYFSEIAENN